jgi:hypothetical protein
VDERVGGLVVPSRKPEPTFVSSGMRIPERVGAGGVPTAAGGAMMVPTIVSEGVMLLIERRALVV